MTHPLMRCAWLRLLPVVLLAGATIGCAAPPTATDAAPKVAGDDAATRDHILDLDCGGQRAELRFEGTEVTLAMEEAAVRVVEQPAAAGTRWASLVLDDTHVLKQGDEYRVSMRGQQLPPCTATKRAPTPFVAIVHEPSWHLSIVDGTMTVRRPGAPPTVIAVGEPAMHEGDRVWRGSVDDKGLVLRVGGARCRDAMSGMLHPATALLTIGGDTHPGCAGDPVDLLAVGEWLVESLAGEAVAEEPPLTLDFSADRRIAGSGGCNRFGGGFSIGEGLTIGPDLMSTMMACPEPVMATERRLMDWLPAVQRFDFDDSGRLVLSAADGQTLVARRR